MTSKFTASHNRCKIVLHHTKIVTQKQQQGKSIHVVDVINFLTDLEN